MTNSRGRCCFVRRSCSPRQRRRSQQKRANVYCVCAVPDVSANPSVLVVWKGHAGREAPPKPSGSSPVETHAALAAGGMAGAIECGCVRGGSVEGEWAAERDIAAETKLEP